MVEEINKEMLSQILQDIEFAQKIVNLNYEDEDIELSDVI